MDYLIKDPWLDLKRARHAWKLSNLTEQEPEDAWMLQKAFYCDTGQSGCYQALTLQGTQTSAAGPFPVLINVFS